MPKTLTNPATGETKKISDWARSLEIDPRVIYQRLKNNLPIEEVLKPSARQGQREHNKIFLTHPKTGETHSITEWSKKLNITRNAILERRNRGCSLEEVLSPEKITRLPWSQEEDEYLANVWFCLRLHLKWNRKARQKKWPKRTKGAIEVRIRKLQQKGLIKTSREEEGILTSIQLANRLGVVPSTIRWWGNKGLELQKEGKGDTSNLKINIADFARWATSPLGAELVSKAVERDQLAIAWLLIEIGAFVNGKK